MKKIICFLITFLLFSCVTNKPVSNENRRNISYTLKSKRESMEHKIFNDNNKSKKIISK